MAARAPDATYGGAAVRRPGRVAARKFLWGLATGLLLSSLLLSGAAFFVLRQGVTVTVAVDELAAAGGREVAAAAAGRMKAELELVRARVPALVASEMAGRFTGVSIDIAGVNVPLPADAAAVIDDVLQDVVSAAIYDLLDTIDLDGAAAGIGAEAGRRIAEAARAGLDGLDMRVRLFGRFSVPVHIVPGGE
jgi:hypothetical protein